MSNIHKSREYKDIFIDNNEISKLTVISWFYLRPRPYLVFSNILKNVF